MSLIDDFYMKRKWCAFFLYFGLEVEVPRQNRGIQQQKFIGLFVSFLSESYVWLNIIYPIYVLLYSRVAAAKSKKHQKSRGRKDDFDDEFELTVPPSVRNQNGLQESKEQEPR